MTKSFPMIDMFCHIMPEKYKKALYSKVQGSRVLEDSKYTDRTFPALSNLEIRLKMLDQFEGMKQVLTIIHPPVDILNPKDSVELARIANDELAELVAKYPDRFIAGVACLPMNDMEAALREAERAMKVLKFKGVQIYTPCNGRPLDSQEFFPLYELMTKYDLPIWLHPTRSSQVADYKDEKESKYHVFLSIGWPYETTVSMVRLVRGGVLERYPSLKIITHHLGGMVPYFSSRIIWGGQRYNEIIGQGIKLSRPPVEYFKMFYGDTMVGNNVPALMYGYSLFGAEHMLFASDIPSPQDYEQKIAPVERMPISDAGKRLIFEGNARRLLHLSQ